MVYWLESRQQYYVPGKEYFYMYADAMNTYKKGNTMKTDILDGLAEIDRKLDTIQAEVDQHFKDQDAAINAWLRKQR